MPVDYSQYFVKKDANVARIKTVEIYNSDAGTFRYVNGFSDRTLTLESGAPRNASSSVTFTAADLEWNDPAQDDSGTISSTVTFSSVGTQTRSIVKQIGKTARLNGIELVLREYLSDNLTSPAVVYYLYSGGVDLSGPDCSISATDTNPYAQNTSEVYTLDRFPGLKVV